MNIEQVLKLLDNAYIGHEGAVQSVITNLSGIIDVVEAADTTIFELTKENQELQEEIGTLERAIITLEEELNEARQALDEALNESPQG